VIAYICASCDEPYRVIPVVATGLILDGDEGEGRDVDAGISSAEICNTVGGNDGADVFKGGLNLMRSLDVISNT
jgi:hypothetical protein